MAIKTPVGTGEAVRCGLALAWVFLAINDVARRADNRAALRVKPKDLCPGTYNNIIPKDRSITHTKFNPISTNGGLMINHGVTSY